MSCRWAIALAFVTYMAIAYYGTLNQRFQPEPPTTETDHG